MFVDNLIANIFVFGEFAISGFNEGSKLWSGWSDLAGYRNSPDNNPIHSIPKLH